MCGAAAIPLMVGSAAVSAYGAYTSAKASKQAGEYSAGLNRMNAQAAEWQATDALVRGEAEAAKVRRTAASVQGTQQAVFASRGVSVTDGSPLSVLEDTDYFSQLDIATVRSNAGREAWAARVRATGAYAEANMASRSAASISPALSAFTSALGSSAQVASIWYRGRPAAPGASAGASPALSV